MWRVRLTAAAQRDIRQAIEQSRDRWGDEAAARYATLVRVGLERLSEGPADAAVPRPVDRAPALRALHLRLVRGRSRPAVAQPRHMLYFLVSDDRVLVIRLLHDRMDPSRHMGEAE